MRFFEFLVYTPAEVIAAVGLDMLTKVMAENVERLRSMECGHHSWLATLQEAEPSIARMVVQPLVIKTGKGTLLAFPVFDSSYAKCIVFRLV